MLLLRPRPSLLACSEVIPNVDKNRDLIANSGACSSATVNESSSIFLWVFLVLVRIIKPGFEINVFNFNLQLFLFYTLIQLKQ